jgi:hypothetical protein
MTKSKKEWLVAFGCFSPVVLVVLAVAFDCGAAKLRERPEPPEQTAHDVVLTRADDHFVVWNNEPVSLMDCRIELQKAYGSGNNYATAGWFALFESGIDEPGAIGGDSISIPLSRFSLLSSADGRVPGGFERRPDGRHVSMPLGTLHAEYHFAVLTCETPDGLVVKVLEGEATEDEGA